MEVGIPPGAYLRQARVDKARRLLVETDEPILVVCVKVGYSSSSSGGRAFKHYTGMTMREYRQEYGEG
jgi:AraC-like DNA-binding protein